MPLRGRFRRNHHHKVLQGARLVHLYAKYSDHKASLSLSEMQMTKGRLLRRGILLGPEMGFRAQRRSDGELEWGQ